MLVEQCGSVERLTLRAPPLNTLNLEAVEALGEYFRQYHNDGPMVVTGDGRAFSAGVDTKAFAGYSKDDRREMFRAITRMTAALMDVRTPVVAAVNGHAMGGGFVLSLCADYRVVVDGEHKFGLTEAQAGVSFPAGPVEIIRDELPGPMLRQLTMSSRIVSAQWLHEQHVYDELVSADDLGAVALRRAEELAQQPAFGEVKQQVRGPLAKRLAALT